MNKKQERLIIIKKICISCVISLILAVGIAFFLTGHLWDIANIKYHLSNLRGWTALNRAYILFWIFCFIGLHFCFPIKKMYNWMFDKRWFIGILLLLFLTAHRYHGDSISYYAHFIQPVHMTETAHPILGEVRNIRSDEFVATTPSILAASYGENPYGKYNDIMRGEDTLNIINGVHVGYATLGYAPQELVYALLPVEYAFSFCWWFPLILGLLMSIELFYIITRKKKLLSVCGAFMLMFSAFFQWWGFSLYYIAAPGVVVCLYYFLQTKGQWRKVLLAAAMAICFSIFVTNLYPAWQVPLGYMFLPIGIWVLHDNWDKFKQLKKKDWAILTAAVIFFVSLVMVYFLSISEYVDVISKTAYPGARRDNGSFYWSKLFYGAQSMFYAYKDVGNASEASAFFSLFPIPTIVATYCWLKEKKKDWLTGGLLIAQLPLLIYITTGFPEMLAKVLLLSNSTIYRTSDIVGMIQIYLIVIILSRYENTQKIPTLMAIPMGILVALMNVYVSNHDFPDYMSIGQSIVVFIIVFGACVGLMVKTNERVRKFLVVTLIAISIFTGVCVRPVMRGLDAIYAKPLADQIQQICEQDPEATWVTNGGGIVLAAYSVACGAPTINSVNTYPNLELWNTLDPNSKYEEIYNRYAHVDVVLTEEETSFELIQADYMRLKLSYQDIEKIGVDYFMTMGGSFDADNSYVDFEKIYEEDGIAIYHMAY